MNKYKLSVDKYINSMDFIEIETNLSETELDSLLDKIEKSDNQTTEDYAKKLEEQGVKVSCITLNSNPYYQKAEVVEIEKIEEPTVFEFLTELKAQVTDEEFKIILATTDADIKFNRVGFNRRTTPEQYIAICKTCANVVLR